MKSFVRLFKIYSVLASYGLDRLLKPLGKGSFARHIIWLTPWVLFSPKRKQGTEPERIRDALVELGPIYVKLGQMLSTRRDLLPDDLADALSTLQDRVPPFDTAIAHTIIEKAYKKPAHEVFASFDDEPLASASIAQVHAAKLKTGEDVIIKVLRPNVAQQIRADLDVMHTLARFAETYSPEARRLHLMGVIDEYESTIINELDLMREAGNGSELRRNFLNSPLLYVPEMYWDYATENVIVMERIYGIPVTDIQTLKDKGVDLKLLAERGVEIFFSQAFRDNFFHADMHPGNIFVNPEHPHDPQYMCVDFGIVASLSEADKTYIGENLLAFFNRDYRRVAQLHIDSGWLHPNTRVDEFEGAVRSVCEPIFEKPLSEISFGTLLLRLIKISKRYGYEVQPQLVLLQKTLLNIEGLGRQLYPDLDLWATAKPTLSKWMKQRLGIEDFIERIKKDVPNFLGDLPEIPHTLKKIGTQLQRGELTVNINPEQLAQLDNQKHYQAQEKQTRSQGALSTALALASAGIGIGAQSYTWGVPVAVGLGFTAFGLMAINLFKGR